ncbi:MAG: amidase family protein, partial [Planctomycetota bacterium]|nr:amidase family protein [Planctomycetota bacterium]
KDPQTSKLPVPDFTKTLSSDLRGMRIGLIQEYMEEGFNNPEVIQAIKAATTQLEKQGAIVEGVSLPLLAEMGTASASNRAAATKQSVDFGL